jgi:hypothetical protein
MKKAQRVLYPGIETRWTDKRSEAYNHIRNIGQGEPGHRKFKRLELGGGQALRPFKCLDCCCSVGYK